MKISTYIILLIALCACNSDNSSAVNCTGKVIRLNDFKSKLVSPRNVDVWLPQNYDTQKSYAVLYMHDGQMLFDGANTWNGQEWEVDETMQRLIDEKLIKETIVVGVWNAGRSRHAEYFPQAPFESLPKPFQDSLLYQTKRDEQTSLFAEQVYSDNYLRFLVEELKPYIDSHYPTLKDVHNTSIAGSSMGGLISIYALCEYPEVFGSAACLSTHWVGTFTTENNPIPLAFVNYLNNKIPAPKQQRIYFDHGTETLDSLYAPYQEQVDLLMVRKKYTPAQWMTRVFKGADHSEKSWRARLDIPLKYLLGL